MNRLNHLFLVVFSLFEMAGLSVYADEPVCHHCEEIREYNAKYHHNYEYYDDYLKAENKDKSRSNKKWEDPASGPISTDSSGVKTVPSSTTSLPSTGTSAPAAPPANQAPQDGTAPPK